MSKAHALFTVAIVVVLAGLTTLAVSKYQHQSKGPTVAQVSAQRDTALVDLKAEKGIAQTNQTAVANLKGQVTTLTNQKATLCAQIKLARLVQPICQ